MGGGGASARPCRRVACVLCERTPIRRTSSHGKERQELRLLFVLAASPIPRMNRVDLFQQRQIATVLAIARCRVGEGEGSLAAFRPSHCLVQIRFQVNDRI